MKVVGYKVQFISEFAEAMLHWVVTVTVDAIDSVSSPESLG
jgi:hypothetical protein